MLARRAGPLRRGARWCRRRPAVCVLLAAVVALAVGALWLVQERRHDAVQRGLAEAERLLALASTERDDQDRVRTPTEKRDLLLAAVAAASTTIARDDQVAVAWFVRARAQHRLGHYEEAIFDLDTAERLRGAPSAEILHFRIDALRQQANPSTQRRLQQDLTTLLQLDPSPHTRALVAEQLLDFAAQAGGAERRAALDRVGEVLVPVGDEDARAAVARARRLELEGTIEPALAAMRRALDRHAGNLYVHLQAAAMFDRQQLADDGAREYARARQLQPERGDAVAPPPVDLDGLDKFLGDVDRILRAIDRGQPANPPVQEPAPPARPPGRERGQ